MGLNNSVCPLVLALSKFQGAVVPPKSCSWEHATAAPQLLGQYWSMFPHPATKGAPAHTHCSAQGQLQPQQCTDGYTSLGRDAALNHLIVSCTVIAVNQTGMGRYREPTDRRDSRGL